MFLFAIQCVLDDFSIVDAIFSISSIAIDFGILFGSNLTLASEIAPTKLKNIDIVCV